MAKQATEKVGSLGHGDPREIKAFLEKNGISCWLDVERVGRVRIFLFPCESLSHQLVHRCRRSQNFEKFQSCLD